MSYQSQNWAVKIQTGSHVLKSVLLQIANYCDDDGSCFVGQERLARDLELGVRTVREALQKLEDRGLIIRTRRYGDDGYRTSDRIRLNASYRQEVPVGSRDLPAGGAGNEGKKTNGKSLPADHDNLTGRSRHPNGRDLPGNNQLTTREQPDTRCARSSRTKKKPSYTPEFEEFWNEVPKTSEDTLANPGSKADAFASWQRLDAEDKQALFQGWQDYLGWIAERRAKRPDYPIKQFVTFINGRLWETYQLGAA